jgi:hypothetical protein
MSPPSRPNEHRSAVRRAEQTSLRDAVEEAGLESFPASDAPAWGRAAEPRLNADLRIALERHWSASDAGDFEAEHDIYAEDAILEYPQSGESIRGRPGIQASRMAQPDKKQFSLQRMLGSGDLWTSELVVTYAGRPSHVVSIMEFESDKVVRETQYFGEPFAPGPSRAQWVDRIAAR